MGTRIEHRFRPVVRSPSGLALRHLLDSESADTSIYVGEQWLAPGEEVLLHTHEVEEVLIFMAGSGTVTLGEIDAPVTAGTTLHIEPGERHGFRNTGNEELRLLVIFPIPVFADMTFVDSLRP